MRTKQQPEPVFLNEILEADPEPQYNLWLLTSTGELKLRAKPHYRIDLDQARTPAEILSWIYQVAGKTWATDHVVADLVRALREEAGR